MKFYTSIAEYYDYIFPFNIKQADLISANKTHNGNLLDIGCATGNLCIEMKKRNFGTWGIDLDSEFINICRQKDKHTQYICENMGNIDILFNNSTFTDISCFGNTLVHLQSDKIIEDFLKKVYFKLDKNGSFICQILNYTRIIKNNITKLPDIDNNILNFKRDYTFREDGLIDFNTVLHIKNINKQIKNSVKLNPVTFTQINKILKKTGFTKIEYYGDLDRNNFNIEESYPLIFVGKK
jgi:cyclopropane fatty-acyl-phospholipid synthase-like methyltransferase